MTRDHLDQTFPGAGFAPTTEENHCGMLMDWLTQSTYKLFVVCCFAFAVNPMWLLFFSRLSVNCVCVCHFCFYESGVRTVFGDLHGIILHSFHWGYSMLQVSSMTFSIRRSFMCVSVYLQ